MTDRAPEADAKAALRHLVISDEKVQGMLNRLIAERGQERQALATPGRTTYTPTIDGVPQPGEVEATRRPSQMPRPNHQPAGAGMRTKGEDAEGGDLRWAGGAATPLPDGNILHSRKINKQYKGEDVGAARFATDLRGKLAPDDQHWTTVYGASATPSVRATSVARPAQDATAPALLRGADGEALTGTFGYVVDPKTGTLHTFKGGEAWVALADGQRLDISTCSQLQRVAVIKAALEGGGKVFSVHHSTALAGGPVAGAGTLTVAAGKITRIDDESGHYQAEAEYLWQTVRWLASKGMAVAAMDVKLIAKGNDPELILKGWKFQLTGGSEGAIRARESATSELGQPEQLRAAAREGERRRAAAAAAEQLRTEKRAALEAELARLTTEHGQTPGRFSQARCQRLSVQAEGADLRCAACYEYLGEEYRVLLGT